MANEERSLSIDGLEVRHVPEPDATYDPEAYDKDDHVTGFVDIGVVVDGAFVILARRKAAGLFADIERAKEARKSERQSDTDYSEASSQ